MSAQKKHTEEEVAEKVVWYLREMGWKIYQEVDFGARADIVGVRGPVCCIVEVKTSLTTDLCAQAWDWVVRRSAHYVYVAAPQPPPTKGFRARYSRTRLFLQQILKEKGIGVFEVRHSHWGGEDHWEIKEDERAHLFRKLDPHYDIRTKLDERQKTFARAGNKENRHWTPWKGTCLQWASYVREHPGCVAKDCIDAVGHHYNTDSSAKSSMLAWIKKGRVEGIRYEREGRRIFLYPEEEGKA